MHEFHHHRTICSYCNNSFSHRHKTTTSNCFCDFSCYKKWKKGKPNLSNHSKSASIILSNKQKQFIVGTLLGDAYMSYGKREKNPHIEISQSVKQFCKWKHSQLFSLLPSKPSLITHHSNFGTFTAWRFRVPCHPNFKEIHNIFYKDKKKIINKKIFRFLTPYALAVWFMDDGSSNGAALRISSNSFTYKEHLILQRFFVMKYKIKPTIIKDKRCDSHYLSFIKKDSIKLRNIIKPYIIPCMKYKLIFQ